MKKITPQNSTSLEENVTHHPIASKKIVLFILWFSQYTTICSVFKGEDCLIQNDCLKFQVKNLIVLMGKLNDASFQKATIKKLINIPLASMEYGHFLVPTSSSFPLFAAEKTFCFMLSLTIFRSCAVFWQARRVSQNTNNEQYKMPSDTIIWNF